MPDVIDWDLATATALRFAPRGPDLPIELARDAVRELRDLAWEAVPLVREVTGLDSPGAGPASVVDRREWIVSNVDAMRVLLGTWSSLDERTEAAPAVVRSLGSQGTALQLGAVLAWVSSKVLGQYEVFASQPGRLLLVAPTIVQVESRLEVPSRDFRLWVCLHEEAHRAQFAAAPWLADHLLGLIGRFLEASDLGLRETLQRLVAFAYAAVRSVRSDVDVVRSLLTEEQRGILDDVTGVMSLLEGHADVVMDAVGPRVIPSVDLIRERFTHRRENPGAVDGLFRRAIGMDAKLRQYQDGAEFVRAVVAQEGMEGINRAWSGPAALPSRLEIHHPELWIERMRTGAG